MKLLAFSTLLSFVSAAFGPIPLFNALSPRTIQANGYTIKPYMDVKKDNVSFGVFDGYVIDNGVYSHHLYSDGDGDCVLPNSLKLFIICGPSEILGPVSHYDPCQYQALLQTPDACGVDFTVGGELTALSSSPRPSGNMTVAAATVQSSSAALIMGALGLSGGLVVGVVMFIKTIRTKGGIGNLLKSNKGRLNNILNDAMKKMPVSEEMKKNITSMVDKQAEAFAQKLDSKLDQQLKGIRTAEGESIDLEAAKSDPNSLVSKILNKKSQILEKAVEKPVVENVVEKIVVVDAEAEEPENKN